jgi:outer membrane receptor protein involved in Fe transport
MHENSHQAMEGDSSYLYRILFPDGNYALYRFDEESRGNKTDRYHTTYVQDIWRLFPDITLEGALFWDILEQESVYNENRLTRNTLNPRLGLTWTPDRNDTFRVAGFRYLIPPATERIDPSDIGGIPVCRNYFNGTLSSEVDLVWEHEWEKAWAMTNLYFMKTEITWAVNDTETTREEAHIRGFEEIVNLLVTDRAGVSAGYRFMDIGNAYDPERNRKDHRLAASLAMNFPSGFYCGGAQTFRYQDMDTHGTYEDETIWSTDLWLGYRFPNKRGGVMLAVTNLFDHQYNWIVDDYVFSGKDPERQFSVTLTLVF